MPVHIASPSNIGQVPTYLPLDPAGTQSRFIEDILDGSDAPALNETRTRADRYEEAHKPTVPVDSFSSFSHRDSVSTSSDSTHSSPTATTLNTTETPGTSPDTPAFFQSVSYPSLSLAMRTGGEQKGDTLNLASPVIRKPRNLKNLAVNTSNASQMGRTISSPSLQSSLLQGNSPIDPLLSPAAPASSNFMKPLNPSRRRGSALSLTIQTPTTQSFASPLPIANPPMTAKLKRPAALRQFQSSPSIPLLTSGLAPEGGMRLPTFTSQFSKALPEHDETEQPDNYDIPQSREEMPASYPDGPICIYEPHVDLYLEPTAEQAAEYDVIFNVASEVRNPFSSEATPAVPSTELKAAAEALNSSNPPDKEAIAKQPEYIHVPWEHNTDIVPDLYDLVKVVDDRVESGKRVLIHCQCGVSRSASLIVAYGIYRNPAVTVQQAYDAVKKRSKWIGPNMNLIMQLQEFRSGLIKSNLNTGTGRSQRQGGRILHGRGVEGNSTHTGGGLTPSAPQTAPLSQKSNRFTPASIMTNDLECVSPGPSSAPCNFSWASNQLASPVGPSNEQIPAPSSYVDAAGQVVDASTISSSSIPQRSDIGFKRLRNAPPLLNLASLKSAEVEPSPRATQFAMTSINHSTTEPSFGITSPRATNFGHLPGTTMSPPPPTPRSTTFAMTALQPSEAIDKEATLGLTSPRISTLNNQLPLRFSPAAVARLGAVRPNEDLSNSLPFAQRRPNRPVSMAAISTTAIPEALMSPRATEFTRNPIHDAFPRPSQPSFADALMSPRATEFTRNPLHDVFAGGPPTQRARASTVATPTDPRSPPLRGATPIVRGIFDVL